MAAPDGRGPSAEARRSLLEWARARGVSVEEPRSLPLPALKVDESLADAVEEAMERAHDAVIALDTDGAERELGSAEALVRAHPELPQASWLLAEVLRGWAARWNRLSPRDPSRAAAAWSHAAALDGGRSAGVGEDATASAPNVVTATLVLGGGETAALDGEPVSAGPLEAAAGEHQLMVTRDGAVVSAEWLELNAGTVVHVALPASPPCSREDLAGARVEGGQVLASGVTCGSWVVAQEVGASELSLMLCDESHCAAPVHWSSARTPALPLPRVGSPSRWPAWATWAIVAGGAVVVTGVAVAASGALRPTHDERVFTTGGVGSSSPMPLRIGLLTR